MKYDWEIVEEKVEELIEKKEIGEEDKDVAKICLAGILHGSDKKKIRELADCEPFETYWSNLESGGYFIKGRGKLRIENLQKNDFPFLMMILVAKGILKREGKRGYNAEYGITEQGMEYAEEIGKRAIGEAKC